MKRTKKCPNCGAEMTEVEETGFLWDTCVKNCQGDFKVLVSPRTNEKTAIFNFTEAVKEAISKLEALGYT
ncbi:zf-TFIIB domain-containing protein [Candidatus Parcubacteria bacterium]|nr:zf-TFIIB domain-containing protein [Candidatus Parcubacteria bacterium]